MRINNYLEEGMPFERAINHLRRTHFPPPTINRIIGKQVKKLPLLQKVSRLQKMVFPRFSIETGFIADGLVQILCSHYHSSHYQSYVMSCMSLFFFYLMPVYISVPF